jgi:hypothetical protein
VWKREGGVPWWKRGTGAEMADGGTLFEPGSSPLRGQKADIENANVEQKHRTLRVTSRAQSGLFVTNEKLQWAVL